MHTAEKKLNKFIDIVSIISVDTFIVTNEFFQVRRSNILSEQSQQRRRPKRRVHRRRIRRFSVVRRFNRHLRQLSLLETRKKIQKRSGL